MLPRDPNVLAGMPLPLLIQEAETMTGSLAVVTYSCKVFIPLTRLCRDVCHYCTFAAAPRHFEAPYLTVGQAVDIAR